MSRGADTKANTGDCGALERGYGASLEPLAQLGDALRSVGATALPIEAAEAVFGQTAKGRRSVSMGIDTKANARAAAHSRLVIFVSLRMAASAEAPFAPMLLL